MTPFPGIQWVGYPRSYTPGRRRPIQYVVLHYTAGTEGPTSAEGGAAYDKRRTDGTSTGYFVDSSGPALQEVPDGDRAHTTRFHGNEIGVSIEMCGTAQTRAQWLDPVSYATITTTAQLTAILLQRHGLAFRRLSVAECRAAYYAAEGSRPTGIVEHKTCTDAYPEDGGDHTDVGAGFPWDVFMALVGEALKPTSAPIAPTEEDDVKILVMQPTSMGGDGSLWLATGVERWKIRTDDELTAVRQIHDPSAGLFPPLGYGGKIFMTSNIGAWGRIAEDDTDALPITDAQIAALAAAIEAELDIPTAQENAEAVLDEEHARLAG